MKTQSQLESEVAYGQECYANQLSVMASLRDTRRQIAERERELVANMVDRLDAMQIAQSHTGEVI